MNDVVLDLEAPKFAPSSLSRRFEALSFEAVTRMGQELYAEDPLLHINQPGRARRLAALIRAKAPTLNAAQFVATRFGGAPHEVLVSFRQVAASVMDELFEAQDEGELDTLQTDRQVWRRLAA